MDLQTFNSFKAGDKITVGEMFPGVQPKEDTVHWKAVSVHNYPNGGRKVDFRLQWRGVNLAKIEGERSRKGGTISWRSSK